MSDLQRPEAVAEEIRAAANKVGALVVPALPGGRSLTKSVLLDLENVLALVRHLRPRLVYLDEIHFEGAAQIADFVDNEDEALVEHALIKAAAKRFRLYEGSLCQVIAIVVHDGIDHATIHESDWLEDVKFSAEGVRTELEQQARAEAERQHLAVEMMDREQREREERTRQSIIREKAAVLGTDPRFKIERVTKAKRRHLAKMLFPDLPNATLTKIVDEAEGKLWLTGSGD